MRTRIRSLPQAFVLFWALLLAAAPRAADPAASQVVGELHKLLLEVMQNADRLGYQGRYEKLAPFIKAHFDTPLISKVVLSRYWDELKPEQRAAFIDLFNQLSAATYASRFDSYSGQNFREIGVEELSKGRLLVKTELVSGNDVDRLDYLMQQRDGTWYIISVVANGVNDLSLKRAEYAAVIKTKGFDGLLADLRGKIADMETGKSG